MSQENNRVMRDKLLRALALAAPVVAAASVLVSGRIARASLGPTPLPSAIIYGNPDVALRFDHSIHVKQVGSCTFCHTTIGASTTAQTVDLPREADCATCHAIDHAQPNKLSSPPSACSACHLSGGEGLTAMRVLGSAPTPMPIGLPSPDLKFNHQLHLGQGIACATCHGDLASVSEPAGLAQLPRMSTCLSCHDGRRAPNRCATCHLTNPDGTLITDLPRGQLAPSGQLRGDAHDLTFRTSHAAVAKSDEKYCLNCHKEKECLDCHEGVVKPFDFHGNDYITKHPIDAERDAMRCASCHRRQDFCIGCHEREGVAVEPVKKPNFGQYDPAGSDSTVSPFRQTLNAFHPVYTDGRAWANANIPSPDQNQHQLYAERNIGTCVSCHTERFCMICHADGQVFSGGKPIMQGFSTLGGNDPHGPDWVSSGRCEALAHRNERVCLQCHSKSNPNFAADLACMR